MRRRNAFTLVELLVVVAIIALLVSMLAPSLGRARDAARKVVCLSALHQLTAAHKTYVAAHEGMHCRARDFLTTENPEHGTVRGIPTWPQIESIPEDSVLVLGGYATEDLYMCPSDNGERNAPGEGVVDAIEPASFSYTRNGQIGQAGPAGYLRVTDISRPSDTALLMEEWEHAPFNDSYVVANSWDLITQRHHGVGGMGFYDNHAEMIEGATFNQQSPLWRATEYFDPP